MKKKGFTLVELLAVIVILAIIALIATPMILNVIDNAKKGAAEASANGYTDALEKGILEQELKGNILEKTAVYNVTDLSFVNIKGDKPTEGWVSLNKGIVTDYSLKIGEYVINYDETNKKIITTKNGTLDEKPSEPIIPSTPSEPTTPEVTYTCKRATTLHTEECPQDSTELVCVESGYTTNGTKGTTTITYGNEEVTVGTLKSGDAFDCDVNGDEDYDENTERFYYVTDLDDDTAVLIYYSNVSGGNPNNQTAYAYNANNVNNMGPVTGLEQLPTTTQWSNVSLKNTSRSITNELGGTTSNNGNLSLPTEFDYSNYAARLLTAQEVNDACEITVGSSTPKELDVCNYLMENTRYSTDSLKNGYWLETPQSYTSYRAWRVFAAYSYVTAYDANFTGSIGIRPVIEVPKTKIQY